MTASKELLGEFASRDDFGMRVLGLICLTGAITTDAQVDSIVESLRDSEDPVDTAMVRRALIQHGVVLPI